MPPSSSSKPRGYSISGMTLVVLSLVFMLVVSWLAVSHEMRSIRSNLVEQGKQLTLSLSDSVNVVQSHIFMAGKSVEHAWLRNKDAAASSADVITAESAALHIDPQARIDSRDLQHGIASASAMLPSVAASHQWNPIFQWTYFYDADGDWFMVYPYLSAEDLYRSTQTGDLSAAIRVFLDADGTRPLELVGPRNNPSRAMQWTPPYEDAGGKGQMVSLLSPVYRSDRFVGAVGVDVTLARLREVMASHAPDLGRTLILSDAGRVMVDSLDASPSTVAGLAPSMTSSIEGTPWTLWVVVDESELFGSAVSAMLPFLFTGASLWLAVLMIVWLNHRRQTEVQRVKRDLVDTQHALDESDRWGDLGEMIASVSREIDQPMQRARGVLDQLSAKTDAFNQCVQQGLRRTELVDFLAVLDKANADCSHELAEARRLLSRFHALASEQSVQGNRLVKVHELAEAALSIVRSRTLPLGIQIDNRIAPDTVVCLSAGSLGQILIHVLSDVIDHCASGQTIVVGADWESGKRGEWLVLRVSADNGVSTDFSSEAMTKAAKAIQADFNGELKSEIKQGAQMLSLRVPVPSALTPAS